MLKYGIDKLGENGDGTFTVYVKLYDDAVPDTPLANICLSYADEASFQSELQRKTEKYLLATAPKDPVVASIQSVFANLESNMETMQAAATEAAALPIKETKP